MTMARKTKTPASKGKVRRAASKIGRTSRAAKAVSKAGNATGRTSQVNPISKADNAASKTSKAAIPDSKAGSAIRKTRAVNPDSKAAKAGKAASNVNQTAYRGRLKSRPQPFGAAIQTGWIDRRAEDESAAKRFPVTPDGRYFVVRGRLWRLSNPQLDKDLRAQLVKELMKARRNVASAKRRGDAAAEAKARTEVHRAKVTLGERGRVWWTDGEPDLNRRLARNTPYADWFASLSLSGQRSFQ